MFCSFYFKLWKIYLKRSNLHCVKSVQIWSFFWSVFSRIWTEYSVSVRIRSECEKIRTRKNSVFGHFARSAYVISCLCFFPTDKHNFLSEVNRSSVSTDSVVTKLKTLGTNELFLKN